ncbi:MAG: hypothetical protein Q4G70_02340 [Pseudomonadota bacterium]|nr:hypothetical protein [Pseudomonadota bacterium]
MPHDDTPAPQPPRFVPTLTEVVPTDADPAPAAAAPAPVVEGASPVVPGADELLARLGPDLDRLISEAIGRVLHEQMLGLNGRVRKAVAEVVREAVAKSLTQEAHGAPGASDSPSSTG